MHSRKFRRVRHGAARLALGSVAVALVTIVSYKLHLNPATVVLLYLTVVLLQSLIGGFIVSVIVSFSAAACLDYFFFFPILSLKIIDPLNVGALFICLVIAPLASWRLAKMREALRNIERRLTLAQNAAGLAVWDCDLGTHEIAISGELPTLYGLAPDSPPLPLEVWLTLVHRDDRDRMKELLQDSLERTHVWDTEFRVVWPDGSIHWLLGKGMVFLDDSGRPSRVVGVNLDITDRRRTQAALRETELQYKDVFENTSECIFVIDISDDGRFKFASFNRAGERTVGLSSGKVSGKFVEDVVDQALANTLTANYRRCVEAGTILSYEEELDLPIGRRLFHTSLIPVRDTAGRIHRIIVVARDITESKRTQEALRISQERLELAQAAAGIGVWDWDIARNQTHCSKEYGPLYGLQIGDLAPPPEQWIKFVHPEDRARVQTELHLALDCAKPYNTEFRVVWEDGSTHWLFGKGQVFRETQGKPIRMLGVNMDITERKHAEQVLRESEERFRNMADTAPVMIWVCGPDKLFTFFNKGWLAFTGKTMEQELGNGWAKDVHPDDLRRCLDTFSASFDSHGSFRMEYRLRRADGEYRLVLDIGVPRFGPDGVLAGYIGSCIDISDLRRAQEEAFDRQKLESLRVLTGGIAHDFNNLLGGILADAELAEINLVAGSSPAEEIQRIRAVTIRTAEIVRELMIYSGQDNTDLAPVDVSAIVEEMLELLKASVSKRAVLKINLAKSLPSVLGNAAQIRQLVLNLMINASEAIGGKHGVVVMTTSFVSGKEHSATNSTTPVAQGGYIRLEISDTGCGMTPEEQAKIFDPFFTTKFAGRGLGLAVVLGIVRDHGGTIDVESMPGQGTTFQILLPCSISPATQLRSDFLDDSTAQTPRAGGTVLLVEDEDALRFSISKMLRRKGFSVLESGDGATAIDLFHQKQAAIDVVLLDMTIPGLSSREVIEEVRRVRPDIKVLLTSAYSREMVTASLDAPQIKGFIRKPFQLTQLVELLHDTISH
jgi:PAS domain S-box-containing protein